MFPRGTLSAARRVCDEGQVRVVTANIGADFAGLFGTVRAKEGGPPSEVSVVVHRRHGRLAVDGHSSGEDMGNGTHVLALLMCAAESVDPGEVPAPRLLFSRRDVRFFRPPDGGSSDGEVLDALRFIRVSGERADVTGKLRALGLRRLDECFPLDAIAPEFRGAFGFPDSKFSDQEENWGKFLVNEIDAFRELGCETQTAPEFKLRVINPDRWFAEIAPEEDEIDWFQFEYGFEIDGRRVNLLPGILSYLQSRGPEFHPEQLAELPGDQKIPLSLGDSTQVVGCPAARLHRILVVLAELHDPEPLNSAGILSLPSGQAWQLSELAGRRPEAARERLPEEGHATPVPFQGTLRPYQEEGFRWLQFLRRQRLGGVLADDMGLGKTVQTLYHLLCEKESGRTEGSTLIVAPKSVLHNWASEAKKFAPGLRVLVLSGPRRKRFFPMLQHADLVITSYPLLDRDQEVLCARRFYYVILDEAHLIKNPRSSMHRAACALKSRHRLCLTGTPIENHLGELWSLFQFLMPGLLGSRADFQRRYRTPIEKEGDEELGNELAERVGPFLLRRTKEEVATDLPARTEIIQEVELHPAQTELYEAVRASLDVRVREEIARRGLKASKIFVLDALLKLRQICCHPALLKLESAREAAAASAKLDRLMEMVEEMVPRGRRVLIFSQFAEMLALISDALDRAGIQHVTLTGQTRDRRAACESFQSGKVPVFLISLKAGGTGLNLTTADTVIHFDPWWNPAVERQATDRAHRIGQKNPVFVYKLICRGSVEEKIVMLQRKKSALYEGILGNAPRSLELTEEDLDSFLAPLRKGKS